MHFFVALLFISILAGPTADAAQPAPSASGYVGSNVCKACHPNVWLTFPRNAHFRSIANQKEPPERVGCEGCHGPGKAHVEAKGGKATIRAFSTLPKRQVLDACLSCHTKDLSRAEIRRSSHTQAGIVCTSCHSIHGAQTAKQLLAKQQTPLCYGCHANVRSQFAMPFKHRVNEGAIQCSDCHNPHGAPAPGWRMGARPRMTQTTAAGEQPCLRCHQDKRGPFAFEHAAVRVDGCETCHNPHGSMNARLLRRPVVFTLCLECHNGVPGFGRTGEGVPTQSASHNMADPRFQNCTTCHVRIHGSNADPTFLR